MCQFKLHSSDSIVLRALAFAPLICLLLADPTQAQFRETFDASRPTWELAECDCIGPEVTWKQRRRNDPNTQTSFEQIYFKTGQGSKILVFQDIPPSFVIPELKPSLKIKATRPGIKLMARVVLPHTPSPDGKGPLKTTLVGETYENTGRWETLGFGSDDDLLKQLQEDVWVLRRKYGTQVNLQNAYIDKLILNLFTGAGALETQIDDLSISGIVSARSIAQMSNSTSPVVQAVDNGKTLFADSPVHQTDFPVRPASQIVPVPEKQPSLVVRDGSVLEVKGKPFFPRIIQYNGEPFDYLKSLGFNTIEMSSTATREQLESAEELAIWLICPAPPSAGLSPIEFEYDRVLAWSVGNDLEGKDLQNVRQRVREIRSSDVREGRPVVAGVRSHWNLFGREADVLSIGLQPLGSSFLASQYSSWIRVRRDSLGGDKPVWATVQTEFASSLAKQVSTLAQQLPPTPIEPQQLKFLTYEALAGGARGLRFASKSRLDSPDPSTRLRAMTIKWITTHVKQLEPWAVGGALMGEIPIDNNHLEVTAFNTNRSRLLLVQRPTHHEQYWAGDTPIETIHFKDTKSTSTDRVLQIGEMGLVPLGNSRNHTGSEVRLDECTYASAVVFTQDPLVINALNQSYHVIGQESLLQMHAEITRQWAAILQLIDSQMGRMGRSSTTASGALNEAINNLRKANELLSGNSPATSAPFLDRADERLAFARREILTQPLGMFKSKTSTPFLTHCSLVPLHWQLTTRLQQSAWNPNGLTGGDFENLSHMTKNGWQNKRIADPLLTTYVELTEAAAVDGRFGLKLAAQPVGAIPALLQTPPVWIQSAPVSVREGQMVRIHGWVNVPRVIKGSHDGLMIVDSLGGRQLCERIPVTKGWQEFTLYRAATSSGEMNVKIVLTGIGEAMVDELTIRTVDLKPNQPRQAKVDQ